MLTNFNTAANALQTSQQYFYQRATDAVEQRLDGLASPSDTSEIRDRDAPDLVTGTGEADAQESVALTEGLAALGVGASGQGDRPERGPGAEGGGAGASRGPERVSDTVALDLLNSTLEEYDASEDTAGVDFATLLAQRMEEAGLDSTSPIMDFRV
ncbi:hypothetical protein E4Z66_03105 [Aliishimia ponticola]|uniref:Uncharacterized protein n=1 Tax=Aliishimia ponticola TaxID=2499833 RepID=A0A4V3XKW9_9RHOB|nr:hypothetical protein [Aliishimia ponticola]THH38573.1 hypothetical protein E4Z66_03105 [Aliishimia ponticola]